MVFSQGQNFYDNLLNYSTKTTDNNEDAIEQNFNLQLRLSDYFRNNQFQTLNLSKLNSGETTYDGKKSALGGPINPFINGATNLPGTGVMADEFPFWQMNLNLPNPTNPDIVKTDLSKDKGEKLLPVAQKQPKLMEQFKNITDKTEYLGTGTKIWTAIIGTVLFILIILGYSYYLYRMKSKPKLTD